MSLCKDCNDLSTCQEQCAEFCAEMYVDEDDNRSRFGVGINDKEDWPEFIKKEFTGIIRYIVFELHNVEGVYHISVFRSLN